MRAAAAAQGRVLRPGLDRHRRLLVPPAARRLRRDHAVQLPGHGPDVDAPDGDRVREHVRAQAVRARPLGLEPRRRAVRRGRSPRRRVQRRPRRQGRGRRAARAPRRRGRLVRRLDADRQVRLRDRDRPRQARAGARRGEEPRRRDARRRPRLRRQPPDRGRLRLGRPALHGDRGHRRRRRRRRPADRAARAQGARDQGRSRPGARLGHGPGRDRAGARADPRLHRPGRRGGGGRGRRRPRAGDRRRRLLGRPDAVRQRHRRHGDLPRRDLRAGARRRSRARPRGRDRADQRQPVRQRHRDLHRLRPGGAHLQAQGARWG